MFLEEESEPEASNKSSKGYKPSELIFLLANKIVCYPFAFCQARVRRNMEDHHLSPGASRPKRKCDDSDAVVELLHGVSLSPHRKKLRQEFGSTSHCYNIVDAGDLSPVFSSADIDLDEQMPNDSLLGPLEIDLPEQILEPLSSPPVNEERAIVLYKPVNPPLFPGGPNAGSQLMLNARALPSGMFDASNLVRGRRENELTWLQAARTGSKSGNDSEVIDEAKQFNSSHDSRLAVVPWVSNSPMNMLISQTTVQTASQDMNIMCSDNSNVEAMEEDSELSMEFVNSQPNNSSINFCYEPWQQFGVSQSPCSSIMWSH